MSMLDQMREIAIQIVKPIRNRVYAMISRAVLESVNDTGGMQLIKITALAGEPRDGVEKFEDYGFTSSPFPGAEAVIVCPQGNREHMIAIKVGDRRFRLKALAKGEVALYTDEGDKIHFKRGNIIDVDCKTLELGNGTLEKIVNGEAFRTLYNAHTHTGNLGSPTTSPLVSMTDSAHLSQVVKASKAAP